MGRPEGTNFAKSIPSKPCIGRQEGKGGVAKNIPSALHRKARADKRRSQSPVAARNFDACVSLLFGEVCSCLPYGGSKLFKPALSAAAGARRKMHAAGSLGIDRAAETNPLHSHLKGTVAAHGRLVASQMQLFPLRFTGTHVVNA